MGEAESVDIVCTHILYTLLVSKVVIDTSSCESVDIVCTLMLQSLLVSLVEIGTSRDESCHFMQESKSPQYVHQSGDHQLCLFSTVMLTHWSDPLEISH